MAPARGDGDKLMGSKGDVTPTPTPASIFCGEDLRKRAFYANERSLVFHCEAEQAAIWLVEIGLQVDCIVTSPPFYGQRDYEVDEQLGLEDDPQEYIDRLVKIFNAFVPVLKKTGSLWVNLGDTYWSGRGKSCGKDKKQPSRRFGVRPQDKLRAGPWTRPKQLLLVPHRFAIAMQDSWWTLRNDNVWVKPNPTPDPVSDRCSVSHEYVFHFVRERFYYFDREAVGRKAKTSTLPPPDTWEVSASRGKNGHKASFSEELVSIPILATCPPGGVVLDPFAGSGTTLAFALKNGRRAVGIDIKEEYCRLAAKACKGQA